MSFNLIVDLRLLVFQVTPAVADSLQKLSRLQSVKLDGCQVTCSGLKAIGNWCVSLKELSLSKCLGVTDEGLCSLVTKHKDLRKLDITCCRKITHVSISHITNSCASLTSLRMESCTLVPREAFVLIGHCCQYLEELDLTDNEIDDEGHPFTSKVSGFCCNFKVPPLYLTVSYICRLEDHFQVCQPFQLKAGHLSELNRSGSYPDWHVLHKS